LIGSIHAPVNQKNVYYKNQQRVKNLPADEMTPEQPRSGRNYRPAMGSTTARLATAVNQIEYCVHQREKKLLANVGIDDDDDDASDRISNGEGVTRQRWDRR
jgi:hypothetical protein